MSSFFKRLVVCSLLVLSSTYCSYDTAETKEELFKIIKQLSASTTNQDLARIGTLLKTFGDINAQDAEGNTVLQYAIKCNNTNLIALLLEHGASLDRENNSGVIAYQLWPCTDLTTHYNLSDTNSGNTNSTDQTSSHPLKKSKTVASTMRTDFFNAVLTENKEQVLKVMSLISIFAFNQGCKVALEHKKIDFFFFLLQNSPNLNTTLDYILNQSCISAILSNDFFLDFFIFSAALDTTKISLLVSYFTKVNTPIERNAKGLKKLALLPALSELQLTSILSYLISQDDVKLLAWLLSIRQLTPTQLKHIITYSCSYESTKCLQHTLSLSQSSTLIEKAFLEYYTTTKSTSTCATSMTHPLPLMLSQFCIRKEVLTEALYTALTRGNYQSVHELLGFGAQITELPQEAFSQALEINLKRNKLVLIEILVASTAHMTCLSQNLKNMLLAYSLEKQNQLLLDQALTCGADTRLIQQHLETFIRGKQWDIFNTVLERVKLPLEYCNFNQEQEISFINQALRRAAMHGLTQAVACLLTLGADIHCADLNGSTDAPLKVASTYGKRQVIEYLFSRMEPSAETLNVCLKNGATQGHLPVIELLLQRGVCLPNIPALMSAVRHNRLSVVRRLLTCQQDCAQAQAAVAQETHPPIIKLLQSFDSANHRRLQAVIQNHSQSQTEQEKQDCLIELRALAQLVSGNLQNSQGNTALHIAVLYNNPQLLKELLALGAQPCIKNWQHQTPFDLAKTLGRWDCIQVFLQAYYTE